MEKEGGIGEKENREKNKEIQRERERAKEIKRD